MKRALLFAALALIFAGCSDNQKQEKDLLNDVIKTHDKLMSDDNIVMKNKMQLKKIINPVLKDSVAFYDKQLGDADNVMMGWMNKFNPYFTGKSHEEIITYLNGQKKEILKVDSQINRSLAASNNFILKNKVK